MNLLAHALLSGEEPGMVVGGVLADWIKGPADLLPARLERGVRRHRRVDAFTDAHPVTAASRGRLRDRWGRYSGILVDLAYDVCLVGCWERFAGRPLDRFVAGVYGMVEGFLPGLPPPADRVARHMIDEDWLQSYARWDGVETALGRVSRRLRRPVPLADAVHDLRRIETELRGDFLAFYPDLVRHVAD